MMDSGKMNVENAHVHIETHTKSTSCLARKWVFRKVIRKIRCLNVIEQWMRCMYNHKHGLVYWPKQTQLNECRRSRRHHFSPIQQQLRSIHVLCVGSFYARPCHSRPSHLPRSHSTLSFGARHYYRTSIPPRSTFKAWQQQQQQNNVETCDATYTK